MKRQMICICCPVGCRLEVDAARNGINVAGNRCPRGEAYGVEEVTAPKRVVTAVVRSNSAVLHYIPVRTNRPLPKEKAPRLLAALYGLSVKVPVTAGAVALTDFEHTGVDVIFTRSIEK